MSSAPASNTASNPGRAPLAVVFGCEGPALTDAERRFFRDVDPLGFILFARNCETPGQVRELVGDLRDAVGRADAPVLIDQEGGRVQRLTPPHWRAAPPARAFAKLALADRAAAREAARLNARLIADELSELGITVDCAPVLDVPQPGSHDVIGDRAFGDTPADAIDLGGAACEGLLDGNVLPVIKHIPGHGRATADSHAELPVVDADRATLEQIDFAPFKALRRMPWAMTAHVVYTAIDPEHPATTSAKVIDEIIRREIGFDGVLVSDDLGMQALAGSFGARAEAALAAGCDVVLHCSGVLKDMEAVAAGARLLTPEAVRRLQRADSLRRSEPFDARAAKARLDRLLEATEVV